MRRIHILGSESFIAKYLIENLAKENFYISTICRKDIDLSGQEASHYLNNRIKVGDSVVLVAAKAPCRNSNDFELNVKIASNLIDSLKGKKIDQLLYVSSDAVYKDSKDRISEESTTGPTNLHGLMHLSREIMLGNEIDSNTFTIVRPTLIYGPNDPHNSYGPNRFLRDALSGNNIQLIGRGEELRDHIYVGDVSKWINFLLTNEKGGTFNLCTGQEISFFDIASVIVSYFSKTKIDFIKRIGPTPHGGFRVFDNKALLELWPNFRFTDIEMHLKMFVNTERKL